MDQTIDLSTYREQYSYYARKLLADLGLGDLPHPERGELLGAIEIYVQQILLNTLLENVHEADADEAEQLLEQDASQETVIAYLLTKIPDVEVKMADAMAAAYAQMLEESRQLAAAIATRSNDPAPPAPTTPPTDNV